MATPLSLRTILLQMKLELNNHDITVTIGVPREDVTINECYDMFASCLIGITFRQQQIDNYILEKAEELSEDIDLNKIITFNDKESEDYSFKSCKD